MKKIFIIANWKENKTSSEAEEWLQAFSNFQFPFSNEKEKVSIVCPSFSLLQTVKELIDRQKLPLKLGSQDFPAFDKGAHTGEEPPEFLQEFVQYAIIGHSERRREFMESDELIEKKVTEAIKYNITPILCVQGIDTPVPKGISLVAYEPVFAIGTGNPDTPENAESVAKTIKEKHQTKYVLYGGSVTAENVNDFTNMPSIDGVLVGGASLDAEKFLNIIKNA